MIARMEDGRMLEATLSTVVNEELIPASLRHCMSIGGELYYAGIGVVHRRYGKVIDGGVRIHVWTEQTIGSHIHFTTDDEPLAKYPGNK